MNDGQIRNGIAALYAIEGHLGVPGLKGDRVDRSRAANGLTVGPELHVLDRSGLLARSDLDSVEQVRRREERRLLPRRSHYRIAES